VCTLGSKLANVREHERGFTLPKGLVTMEMVLTALFAPYSVLDMSPKGFSFGNNKVEVTESAPLRARPTCA
jgi:hypothetical protein